MPDLIILMGVPASGKSTWAEERAVKGSIRVVSSDGIRALYFGDINDQSHNSEVWEIVYDMTDFALSMGEYVILDATHASKRVRAKSIEAGRKADARVLGVYFPISVVEAKIRNLARDRTIPDHVIDRMARQFQDEPPSIEDGFDEFYVWGNHNGD